MFAMPVAGGPTTRGGPGTGPGFRIGRGHSARERSSRGCWGVPGGRPRRGDPHTGRGTGPLSRHGRRQPGAVDAELRTSSAMRSRDLEFMVSIDMYLNETTRHADVILPPPSQLQRSHYDVLLLQFAVRNVANYSGAVLPLDPGQPDEWEIIAKLALIAQGQGVDADVSIVDDQLVGGLVAQPRGRPVVGGPRPRRRRARSRHSPQYGRRGPERMLDLMLRSGPVRRGLRRRSRRGVTRRVARQPARRRLRRARAAAARDPAHAVAADRARRTGAHRRPRSAGGGDRRARPDASWCSSGAATCAATTRGCTTSRCW